VAVYCVLGMHRSGTSVLTGSLQQVGLCLGPHSTWNRFNQRGNRENPRINDLHDDLLASNGGIWYDPPKGELVWSQRHWDWAGDILSEYPDDRPWGFKDPKTLTALTGWQELIGGMTYIGVYRHPLSVARSLEFRNKLSIEHGLSLWLHYNELLVQALDRYRFPLLSFDWDEETFHTKLESVLPDLGLPGRLPEGERFFTPELRHHKAHRPDSGEDIPLPTKVAEMYRELQVRSL